MFCRRVFRKHRQKFFWTKETAIYETIYVKEHIKRQEKFAYRIYECKIMHNIY